ncbi:MAG TPA: hypothetical protein VLZ10_02655 [Thermodesulfobacteriota bacterium]|nr:hypothetical protein [Thermodesulfobacteriota bacterium]
MPALRADRGLFQDLSPDYLFQPEPIGVKTGIRKSLTLLDSGLILSVAGYEAGVTIQK